MCPSQSSSLAEASAPSINAVKAVVEQHFPDLWPATEAALSTCATLLLADNSNPVTLILCGAASSGKTTIINMFEGVNVMGNPLMYRSDKFTAAAFVSHSAQATSERLQKIDLLPKIKNKVLLTPELSTLFRGKPDELERTFTIITRVLDGQGLMIDSGTHGRRGYEGPHIFAWIGATTPLNGPVWRIMATLGSRLFFFVLEGQAKTSTANLVASLSKEVPHAEAIKQCQGVIGPFLDAVFTKHGGVSAMKWNRGGDSQAVLWGIGKFAELLAVMRTTYDKDNKSSPESPHRAYVVLYNLARGHALVHGRTELTAEDVPLIAQVALSSIPQNRRGVLLAMAKNQGKPVTVSEAEAALEVSRHTAESVMQEMHWLGVATLIKVGNGVASLLEIKSEWQWFMEGEGLAYLQGTTWQKMGGERAPGTSLPFLNLD